MMYRVDQQQENPTMPAGTIAKMWKTLNQVRPRCLACPALPYLACLTLPALPYLACLACLASLPCPALPAMFHRAACVGTFSPPVPLPLPTVVLPLLLSIVQDEKIYYMEEAHRENTADNPPRPDSPEENEDGVRTRGTGNAGAYSTGAAKYRKNRGTHDTALCSATHTCAVVTREPT